MSRASVRYRNQHITPALICLKLLTHFSVLFLKSMLSHQAWYDVYNKVIRESRSQSEETPYNLRCIPPHGLGGTAQLKGTDRARSQKRREVEVAVRRDDSDI